MCFSSDFISDIVKGTMIEGIGKGEEEDIYLDSTYNLSNFWASL